MATKLTLRLEEELINNVKIIAKSKGISLSKLVADYFRAILARPGKIPANSPVLSEITGILRSNPGKEKLFLRYKKHIEEKYL